MTFCLPVEEGMLRCLIAMACSLWVTCSFGQLSPSSISAGNTAEIVCRSESEEIVLHANASATLPLVDILSCGAHVTVMAKQTGWYRVRIQDGKDGYVKDVFFTAPATAQAPDAAFASALPQEECREGRLWGVIGRRSHFVFWQNHL